MFKLNCILENPEDVKEALRDAVDENSFLTLKNMIKTVYEGIISNVIHNKTLIFQSARVSVESKNCHRVNLLIKKYARKFLSE